MTRAPFDLRKETRCFTSIRNNALAVLDLVGHAESILDVGCGATSPLRFAHTKHLVGIDGYEPDVEKAIARKTHNAVILGDIRRLSSFFHKGDFEVCVALDVIEHLTRDEALQLLTAMEGIARRRVIISTPNGFLPQDHKDAGDLQVHRSGWSVQDLEALGYTVSGLIGLKVLRASQHKLRFKPNVFWALVSWTSQQLWCATHPESAAGLLCWKTLESRKS